MCSRAYRWKRLRRTILSVCIELRIIEVGEFLKHADAAVELIFGEGFEALQAEFFYGEGCHRRTIHHGPAQRRIGNISAIFGDVAKKSPRKSIARACRIKHIF